MMVPQEPSLFEHSSTNLNTSAIVLSQEPYHGSSGSIPFDKQFHKFEHFCMPPRAPSIILNKARGGTRNLHPEAHPALFSIIRGGGGVHATLAASAPSVPGVPGAPGAPGAPSAPGFASTAAATAAPGAPAPQAPQAPRRTWRCGRPKRPWRSRRSTRPLPPKRPKCPRRPESPRRPWRPRRP